MRFLRPACAALFAAVAVWTGLAAIGAAESGDARTARAITVTTEPLAHFQILNRDRTEFGPLTYLGGFELQSPVADVGGLSAIESVEDGRVLLLLTDNGLWLRLELEQAPNGAPAGVSHAYLAPMLDARGKAILGTQSEDAESFAFSPDGEAIVGFERRHRIAVYPFGQAMISSLEGAVEAFATTPSQRIALPPQTAFRYNGGLEAMTVLPATAPRHAGEVAFIAERPLDGEDTVAGALLDRSGARRVPVTFRYQLADEFRPTDMAALPNGDLLVLERRFAILRGISMRIVRLALADLTEGAVVSGETLLQVGLDHQIDNMEGLDIASAPDGSTILTLVSDNNRSLLQRSLILRFRLNTETAKTRS